MLKVGIIVGSTRPGRNGEAVARWVQEQAAKRGDAHYELVDIADFGLPLLDEPVPAAMGQYGNGHTRRWADKIGSLDAFVFVTPEYNHSTSAALKNALDYLFAEWTDKAAAFVGYGSAGGARAVEHLRTIVANLGIADVRGQVGLSLFEDFEDFSRFKPREMHLQSLDAMLDQLVGWGIALKRHREGLLQRKAA